MHKVDLLFRRLVKLSKPTSAAVNARVWRRVQVNVHASSALETALKQVVITPNAATQARVWQKVHTHMHPLAERLLHNVPALLPVPVYAKQRVWQTVQDSIIPKVESFFAVDRFKWLAAVTAVAIIATMSPRFVVAPPILAGSQVTLVVTSGEVSLLQSNLWEPIKSDLLVKPGMIIHAEDGGATISVRDDAVLRIAPFTTVHILDTQDTIDSAPEPIPAFYVESGTVWLLGMVPSELRGITIASPQGYVTVNEGSISLIVEPKNTEVTVWDRHAPVHANQIEKTLYSGQRVRFTTSTIEAITDFPAIEFSKPWAKDNLSRDAVHRQYIAHLQHERLSSFAGTLPTSSLYPVKRFAEKVDVLFSFSEEQKVQKQLTQAQRRLSEAAALLQDSNTSEAVILDSLNEYKLAVNEIVVEAETNTVSQLLLQQNLETTKASLAATKPGDAAYEIKKTVLVALADLPVDSISNSAPDLTLLTDALDVLSADIEAGNFATVQTQWPELTVSIQALQGHDAVQTPQQIEALAILEKIAVQIKNNDALPADIDSTTVAQIAAYAPVEPLPEVIIAQKLRTAEEVEASTAAAYARIYSGDSARGRENRLRQELMAIAADPESGRLLRSLYRSLPAGSQLNDQIRAEIVRLKVAAQQ